MNQVVRPKVFISHCSEDTWVASQIAREIGGRGTRAFLDEADMDIGDSNEALREALDGSDELLVLVTPWALDRPWVWVEIGGAWLRRIPIIVVLHGLGRQEFMAQPATPAFLKTRDIIRLNDIEQYFEQLQRRATGGPK
ncbi:toll/interleukin-1 receptor domain-containing protein [uncultured Thiodictyon sp.]|uniref:toll/interleukin-1 receptor domain-containing protein n=1 Tax=uncultured Thiodictyon sp. TaxID=1846217 RepID=UPI0025E426EA|nr:toll/interleukin-1 receptor domain-containing protein [uncultured Thiodictyon sp.]